MANASNGFHHTPRGSYVCILTIFVEYLTFPRQLSFGALIKRVYFHPLSRYPGPKLWAVSRIPYVYAMWSGKLGHRIRQFHEQYGPTIRLAPDELSFINPSACRDILARRSDGAAFAKNPIWVPPPGPQRPTNILNAPDEEHQRIRRAWSYGFSDSSLKSQEPLISTEVDKLMEKLRETTKETEGVVNIAEWFGFCVFDISGSLSFGASYGCLDSAAFHESLQLATYSIKASVLMAACRYFPLLFKLMTWTIARTAQSKQKQHVSFSQKTVRERLQKPTSRPDFLHHMQSSSRILSDTEIEANAGVIASASTNTTNTTLLGTVTFLLRFPETLDRLTDEVRGTFTTNENIKLDSLVKLPYLSAVIEEGLRIVSPIPLGTPRVVPHPGSTVCGEFIPGGVSIWSVLHTSIQQADSQTTDLCGVYAMGGKPFSRSFHQTRRIHTIPLA